MAYSNQNRNNSGDSNKIGSLWKKVAKNSGQHYLSGFLDVNGVETPVVIFAAKTRKQENSPDFYIFESTPLENAPAPARTAPAARTRPAARPQQRRTAPVQQAPPEEQNYTGEGEAQDPFLA